MLTLLYSKYISILSPFRITSRMWWGLLLAPDTISLGDVRKSRRQVELGFGFLSLGTLGLGHLIPWQLTNPHGMNSEGSWRRILMPMITTRLG